MDITITLFSRRNPNPAPGTEQKLAVVRHFISLRRLINSSRIHLPNINLRLNNNWINRSSLIFALGYPIMRLLEQGHGKFILQAESFKKAARILPDRETRQHDQASWVTICHDLARETHYWVTQCENQSWSVYSIVSFNNGLEFSWWIRLELISRRNDTKCRATTSFWAMPGARSEFRWE